MIEEIDAIVDRYNEVKLNLIFEKNELGLMFFFLII